MEKLIKGQGSLIEVYDNDSILVKIMWQKNYINFSDIICCNVSENSRYPNLIDFSVLTNSDVQKNKVKMATLYKEDKDVAEQIKTHINNCIGYIPPSDEEIAKVEIPLGMISGLDYLGGHPCFPKEGISAFAISTQGLTLLVGNHKEYIPFENVTGVHFETQDQIESRYTATRILALGVFALAFKKKKKTADKFLSIDYTDNTDISNTIVCSGKKAQDAHSLIYKGLSDYRKLHPKVNEIHTSQNTSSNLDEIKKLKELLDIGAISQEEFDSKKKQLLDL